VTLLMDNPTAMPTISYYLHPLDQKHRLPAGGCPQRLGKRSASLRVSHTAHRPGYCSPPICSWAPSPSTPEVPRPTRPTRPGATPSLQRRGSVAAGPVGSVDNPPHHQHACPWDSAPTQRACGLSKAVVGRVGERQPSQVPRPYTDQLVHAVHTAVTVHRPHPNSQRPELRLCASSTSSPFIPLAGVPGPRPPHRIVPTNHLRLPTLLEHRPQVARPDNHRPGPIAASRVADGCLLRSV